MRPIVITIFVLCALWVAGSGVVYAQGATDPLVEAIGAISKSAVASRAELITKLAEAELASGTNSEVQDKQQKARGEVCKSALENCLENAKTAIETCLKSAEDTFYREKAVCSLHQPDLDCMDPETRRKWGKCLQDAQLRHRDEAQKCNAQAETDQKDCLRKFRVCAVLPESTPPPKQGSAAWSQD